MKSSIKVVALIWFSCLLSGAAFAIASMPATITYVDASGLREIYSFATADCKVPVFGGCNSPQHLVVNYFDGYAWHWADMGLPPGANAVYSPNAITYLDSSGHQEIYAFGQANNGHLVVLYWDGHSWHWADRGVPPGKTGVASPSAVTYVDAAGHRRIYTFGESYDGHMVVLYFDGFKWNWADMGLPPGNSSISNSNAITYLDSSGRQEMYVFADGGSNGQQNGHMVVLHWNGFNWNWADKGFPPGKTGVYASPSAITYLDAGGNRRIYSFVMSNDQHLVVLWWDGSNWHWADMGLPAGASAVYWPSAITYRDASGNQRIYAFDSANNGHLVVLWWDGSNWHWADQGLPAGSTGVWNPDAITYVDAAGRQEIYAFAEGGTPQGGTDLVVNYWNGLRWNWADQGTH